MKEGQQIKKQEVSEVKNKQTVNREKFCRNEKTPTNMSDDQREEQNKATETPRTNRNPLISTLMDPDPDPDPDPGARALTDQINRCELK